MQDFMNYDFNITDIKLAIYVEPGSGNLVHKNRASHGLAIATWNSSKVSEYFFGDNKRISLEKNEIIYLPKGSDYVIRSDMPGDCYAINFDFSEERYFQPFSFKVKNSSRFIDKFRLAAELWTSKKIAFNMQCKALLYDIISSMQNEYSFKYMSNDTTALIKPAVDYVHSHYTDKDLNVTELSNICGISENYLRKIFNNVYGVSPKKFINNLKITYAKELILSGTYSVSEACVTSGYSDPSYFSRVFKKSFGVPPTEYYK